MAMLALFVLSGCRGTVNKLVTGRVLDHATDVPDVGLACATGEALTHALRSATKKPAHQAMLIANLNAGLCAEVEAREAELRGVRALSVFEGVVAAREARDAAIVQQRAHRVAAHRFVSAWQYLIDEWGVPSEDCPKLESHEEPVYLLGLWAGINAVLHDKASGNALGVPLDVPAIAARGTECIDNVGWWHAPRALQAAAWAAIPGSGPTDVDPWVRMAEEAEAGAKTGVRLSYAILSRIAGNAGREDDLRAALEGHAVSLSETPPVDDWALFDRYAEVVSLHEADLLLSKERGVRATSLLEFFMWEQQKGAQPFEVEDPFASDPFAEDPFAEESPVPDPESESEEEPQVEETPE